MFSTSMIASSTTTPIATAKPPSVIVLMETPNASSTSIAASNESGIETNEMNAVRRSRRKRNSTIPTKIAPSTSECSTLCSACSMKVAGRCSRGKSVMPSDSNTGPSSPSARSTASVASIVFAPNWLAAVSSTPGSPMISASPNFGSAESATTATSRKRTLTPSCWPTTTAPISAGVSDWPSVCTSSRCVGVSTKPAPRTPLALFAAATTSCKVRSNASSRAGSTCT